MTKRQWRRVRGRIIARNFALVDLRKVKFTSMVMTQLVEAFTK